MDEPLRVAGLRRGVFMIGMERAAVAREIPESVDVAFRKITPEISSHADFDIFIP
jgi:hypothetical protein